MPKYEPKLRNNVSVRLQDSTIAWLQEKAEKENVNKYTTMIRLILEREQFREETQEELESKLKKGRKN